jgi:hypothetical protein
MNVKIFVNDSNKITITLKQLRADYIRKILAAIRFTTFYLSVSYLQTKRFKQTKASTVSDQR